MTSDIRGHSMHLSSPPPSLFYSFPFLSVLHAGTKRKFNFENVNAESNYFGTLSIRVRVRFNDKIFIHHCPFLISLDGVPDLRYKPQFNNEASNALDFYMHNFITSNSF